MQSFKQVDHLVLQEEDLSGILYRFDESDFTISQFEGLRMDGSEVIDDDGQMMPSSILEDHELQYRDSSCSNNSDSVMSHSTEAVVKKKNKGILPGIMLSLGSRRKGAPQRAPLS